MNTMMINLTSVFNEVFGRSSGGIIVTPGFKEVEPPLRERIVQEPRRSERISELYDTDKKEDENNCTEKKNSKRLIDLNDKDNPEDLIGSNVKKKKKREVRLDVIDMINNDEHIKNLSLEWKKLLDKNENVWKKFREHKNFIKALQAVNTIGNDESINYYYINYFISIEYELKKWYQKYPNRHRYYSKIIKLIARAIKWVCIFHYETHGLDSVLMILYAVLKETKYSFRKAFQNLPKNWLQKDKEKMRLEYRKFLLCNVQYVVFEKCCVIFSDLSGLKNICLSGKHPDNNIKCCRIKDFQQTIDANYIINNAKDLDCLSIPNDGISLQRMQNHIKRIDVDNKYQNKPYLGDEDIASYFITWQSQQKVDWNGFVRLTYFS